jgi:hypothetical protein
MNSLLAFIMGSERHLLRHMNFPSRCRGVLQGLGFREPCLQEQCPRELGPRELGRQKLRHRGLRSRRCPRPCPSRPAWPRRARRPDRSPSPSSGLRGRTTATPHGRSAPLRIGCARPPARACSPAPPTRARSSASTPGGARGWWDPRAHRSPRPPSASS